MAWMKRAYLYLVSLITLIIMVVAAIGLINMGLKGALGVDDRYYDSYSYCEMKPMDGSTAPSECTEEARARREEADKKNAENNRKRDLARNIAMLLVSSPVFYYHWRLARKEQ
jgi:hypothetical protein